MNLRERAMQLSVGCELMISREKGETEKLQGIQVTIKNFDFLTDSEKNIEYSVFIIEEEDSKFFFGGTVLTDKLKQLQGEGYQEEIQKDGLPVLFGKQQPKDKKKQPYTTVTFYPEPSQK